ncbi:hypothetical protein CAPTEDRAFT_214072 [Capitella teleta]|uniref:C-type lectin domain-containing protein n=1 Tax=Capitella teleta TaxID=283909 RepID=R7TJU0_CAPTE|nr:hypothetical protein CAPTEDRAFT_214072 [Capitella teleta]|eukprot:ELT94098.1 hypothetical protein CAPTEDRAFT_214072 [Capitella teleta]
MRNPERRTVGSAWAFNVLVMLRMCSLNAGETLCDDDWKFFGGSCYLVRGELSIQAGAQDYCEMYESNLASIHSDEEQDFIHSILNFGGQQHQAWIGLTCDSNCVTEQSNWRWMDGSPMDYKESWGVGEPDSYDPCARLRSDNIWGNSACSSVYYSVCEKPGKETEESGGGSTIVATPAPSTIPTAATRTTTTTVTPPIMQSDAASSSSTTKNTTINKITASPPSSSALSTTARTTEVSSGTEMDTSTAANGSTFSTNDQGSPANYVIAVLSVLLIVVIVAFIYFNREKIIKTKSKERSVHDGDLIETTTDANSTPCGQVNDSVYSGIDDTKSIHDYEDITGQERPKSGKYGENISVDISSNGSGPKEATHVYDNADVNSDRPAQNTSDPVDASGDPVAIDNEGLYERPQNEVVSVHAYDHLVFPEPVADNE